jgi:hypothetical protein
MFGASSHVAAFAASDAHKIVTEVNPAGVQIIKFDTTESLPTLVNLIFGDAVHNLRAALDYAWAEAILTFDSAADIANLHFPILENRNSCIGTLDDGKKEHAAGIAIPGGQKLRTVMLDSIEPYGAWDNPLARM